MTTKYIILTKDKRDSLSDNSNNQIFFINKDLTYLMPAINYKYYMDNGLFENSLIEWCKQFGNKDGTFLDIGAHTGSYSISLARYFKHVYAFEPQKMTYYALCGGVALSNCKNIDCLNFGLGNNEQVGKKDLYVVSNDGGGSTVHVPINENTILNTEEIEIRTLDSFKILVPIALIKMDVEENELYVLQGAYNTIIENKYPKIIFEVNNKSNSEVIDYLKNILGYEVIGLLGTNNMYLAHKP